MAAANGDLIQLVDNQSYLGQQCLNVYYYRIIALLGVDGGYLEDMNDWFETNVLGPVRALQVTSISHVSREWRNLSNGTDLFVDGSVVTGTQSASEEELLPSYVSLGFMLQRESLATRNGYKRIAGISENVIEGNIVPLPNATIAAVEAGLAADITIGGFPVAEPVIVKRPIVVPVASYVYSSIGSAQFRSVGTQNTRKAGRGV